MRVFMKSMNNVLVITPSEHQLVNVLHIIMNCHTS